MPPLVSLLLKGPHDIVLWSKVAFKRFHLWGLRPNFRVSLLFCSIFIIFIARPQQRSCAISPSRVVIAEKIFFFIIWCVGSTVVWERRLIEISIGLSFINLERNFFVARLQLAFEYFPRTFPSHHFFLNWFSHGKKLCTLCLHYITSPHQRTSPAAGGIFCASGRWLHSGVRACSCPTVCFCLPREVIFSPFRAAKRQVIRSQLPPPQKLWISKSEDWEALLQTLRTSSNVPASGEVRGSS